MEIKCIDIKKNSYKLQAAFKKPWYTSYQGFYRKLRRSLQDLPNYSLSTYHKYIILDIYFDDTGRDKDLALVETVSRFDKKSGLFYIENIDHSRIVNLWI